MVTISTKNTATKISIPISIEELANGIWHLPPKDREVLGDILEEKFVKTLLRRAKDVSRLKREKKLLSLRDLEREFSQ